MNKIDIKIKIDKKGRVVEVSSRGKEVDINKVVVEYENG